MLRDTVTGPPRAAIARVPSAFVRVPATVAEWLAASTFAAITLGVLVILPNLRVDVGMVPFFYPFFGSVVTVSQAVTALILFWRAELAHERRVAVLGGTYLFAALVALANVLALPSSMSGAGLFGPHAAAWYRVFGHLAWPLGIAIFAWMPSDRNRGPARALVVALAAALGAIALGAFGATVLPPLVDANGAFLPTYYFAFAISSVMSVIAICSLLRRKPTSLELWVTMSVLFLLAETILSMRSGVRFSLGSYVGRGFGVASALVVFVALTGEYIALLRRANVVERFATIAEAAPVITIIADDDGRCSFVNGRWTALTGQSANDAFGAGYRNVIHAGDLERVEGPWRIANRARREFATELRFYDAATQRHRWHLIRSSALGGDGSGRVDAWLVTATDIDDQRRALDEARAAQLEFQRIAEAIPQIVWTALPDGTIDWANANWYAYSGLATVASLDTAWRTVSHTDDRAEILRRWQDAVDTGQPVEMEFRLLRKDGAYRWFLTRVVPVRDNAGSIVRWYGTSTDIDERRRQGDELTRLYEREHSVAKALQSAFLPPFLPDVAGIAFDAVYRPAARETEVGGDWYDAFLLPDDRVAISVGDVMGHGLEAATAMVRVRESLRAAAMLPDLAPDGVLRTASRALAIAQSDVLATATYGVLDRNAATFSYACAGHPGPLLRRASGVKSLAGGGTLLGLEGVAASTHVVALRTGDILAFYTDGLVESERDIERGELRLVEALAANGRDAEKIVAQALTSEPRDDVALLTVAIDALPNLALAGPNWKFASDDARTAQVARSSFVAYLRAHDVLETDIAAAEIVFGELVGNVVRHAPGPIDVELAWNVAAPLLVVRDRGAGFEPRSTALPADDYSENGRGLYLIKTFANMPSVRRRADGGAEISVQLALQGEALGTRSA